MIKWILVTLILFLVYYTLSFAKYSWKSNNKLAAWGAGILAIFSVILPIILMVLRYS